MLTAATSRAGARRAPDPARGPAQSGAAPPGASGSTLVSPLPAAPGAHTYGPQPREVTQ